MTVGRFVVTAPAVAVSIPAGPRTSQVRFVEQGGTLPDGVDPAAVEHLLSMGMIATQAEEEPPAEPAPAEPTAVDLLESLTAAELRRLADERGVAVPKGATKAVLIEELKHAERFPEPDMSSLEVADLLAQAAARGIDVPDGVTDRDDLIALLEQ